jgi:hypothetical protein
MRYWIGVASSDHVMNGVKDGFCQLGHGKKSGLEKMHPGDWIIYYSPRQEIDPKSQTLQSFTAIGQILPTDIYQTDLGDFKPWRRDVAYHEPVQALPIQDVLEDLSFIKNPKRWGYSFRFGQLEISKPDFELISRGMDVSM